jgi:Methyltransferase domain
MLALRRISRSLLNMVALRPLPGPFPRGTGHSWIVPLAGLAGQANRYLANHTDVWARSPLVVHEDGVPLGPAHSPPDRIRDEGGGRFNHWYGQLLFSTSDNSDPNTNGRSYACSLSPRLFKRRAAGRAHPGLSLSGFDSQAFPSAKNWNDVVAAVRTGLLVLGAFREHFPSPAGKPVLEVGPGWGYGSAMVLACYGMRPVVADHFLIPWDEPYHGWYYGAVADELARADPSADVTPLRDMVRAGRYDDAVLRRVHWPPADFGLPSESVDLVYSLGVIEYLDDLEGTFRHLARVTRPGGLGLHHVDCSDQSDPLKPLEYLLPGDAEFAELFARCHGECGNRRRPTEVTAEFRQAGFEVFGFDPERLTRMKYVDDLLSRLRRAAGSRYRDLQPDELRIIQGWCRVRKPA